MTVSKRKNEWIEWGKAILIALLIAFILRSFVFATSIVEGESMEPTLENGERVIFNKIVYLLDEPERGDVVIIERPSKNYVKRVIGLPGETIAVNGSELYINGEKYEQTFLDEGYLRQSGNFGPIEIPQDSYYVMGDNRSVSKDSRNGLGFIEEDTIIGKSELIIYPFSEWARTK
ncbi:signal peptidase I [Virgibacillus ainsalahensis]